jgi:L-iditol 2-dehydrogenase
VNYRIESARKLGADLTIQDTEEGLETDIRELNDGRGADLVIVTPGSAKVIEQGMRSVARGGTVLLYAPLPPGETMPVEVHHLLFSEVTLVSTYSCGPDETRTALEFIRRGRVQTKCLITHRFGLDEVGDAIRLAERAGEFLKLVIVP